MYGLNKRRLCWLLLLLIAIEGGLIKFDWNWGFGEAIFVVVVVAGGFNKVLGFGRFDFVLTDLVFDWLVLDKFDEVVDEIDETDEDSFIPDFLISVFLSSLGDSVFFLTLFVCFEIATELGGFNMGRDGDSKRLDLSVDWFLLVSSCFDSSM